MSLQLKHELKVHVFKREWHWWFSTRSLDDEEPPKEEKQGVGFYDSDSSHKRR